MKEGGDKSAENVSNPNTSQVQEKTDQTPVKDGGQGPQMNA